MNKPSRFWNALVVECATCPVERIEKKIENGISEIVVSRSVIWGNQWNSIRNAVESLRINTHRMSYFRCFSLYFMCSICWLSGRYYQTSRCYNKQIFKFGIRSLIKIHWHNSNLWLFILCLKGSKNNGPWIFFPLQSDNLFAIAIPYKRHICTRSKTK